MKADIRQFQFFDPKLRMVLLWLEETTGVEFTATSFYRMDDDGVHGTLPLRGTDLRQRLESAGLAYEEHINNHWSYDINRETKKVAKLHGKGLKMHLHIQVHPNTTRL